NYIYDIENRLTEVRDNENNLIASYSYDPFGKRISKTTVEGTRYFYYADSRLIAEFSEAGNQIQAYGFTPDRMWGKTPAFTRSDTSSYFYYLNDHLGTPQK